MPITVTAARQLGEDLLSFANGSCRGDNAEVIKLVTEEGHRTLQQCVMGLFVDIVRAHAKKGAFEFDGRNEATVKLCKAIVERCEDELALPFI